jgi:hypothetical protein
VKHLDHPLLDSRLHWIDRKEKKGKTHGDERSDLGFAVFGEDEIRIDYRNGPFRSIDILKKRRTIGGKESFGMVSGRVTP